MEQSHLVHDILLQSSCYHSLLHRAAIKHCMARWTVRIANNIGTTISSWPHIHIRFPFPYQTLRSISFEQPQPSKRYSLLRLKQLHIKSEIKAVLTIPLRLPFRFSELLLTSEHVLSIHHLHILNFISWAQCCHSRWLPICTQTIVWSRRNVTELPSLISPYPFFARSQGSSPYDSFLAWLGSSYV